MDISIGIQNVAREINLEVEEDSGALSEQINAAVNGQPLVITDVKGRTIHVPAGALGYVLTGETAQRRVGFAL